MTIDEVIRKYTVAVSAAESEVAKIPRRKSLYLGEGKIVNKRTGKSVQAECHQNITFELIESQISNTVPEPLVTPMLAEDAQRALALQNYLSQTMKVQNGIAINDKAERGTYQNGYCFYLIEWDQSKIRNSGFGGLKLTYYPAGSVFVQAGITDFNDAEYVFLQNRTTCRSIKQLYGVDVPPDVDGQDVCDIVTCYYLNDEGNVGRTIFAKNSYQVISEDDYFELRRIVRCKKCGEPILNLDMPCPVCNSEEFEYAILDEEVASQDIYIGNMEENAKLRAEAQMRGEVDDEYAGLTKIVAKGDKIPFYHIRELPVVMRVNISTEDSIYGLSDIDMIEQNQDTLNRLTTKEQENLLKAGSFVTYPEGTKIPADDSTLKMVPISDPRLITAFSVQTIQANMQQDDILATRMYQYGRAALGITESYQGKKDTTATSGKAKQLAAAQSAGRLESKQRMKVQAYSDIYKKEFKFLLAYADETQHYVKYTNDGDILQLQFNRYQFLKKNMDTNQLYWDDNFIIEADNASLITNKQEMWEVLTQQFLSGSFGLPSDPAVLKLYWSIMKQLQFPFAAAIQQNLNERNMDLDPAVKGFILSHPDILDKIAQLMAMEKNGGQAQQAGISNGSDVKLKTGQNAMQTPEPANPVPPAARTELSEGNNGNGEEQ